MAEAQLQQFLDKVRQLNAFVALSEDSPALRDALRRCSDHHEVVRLAADHGFEIGRRWGDPGSGGTASCSSQTAPDQVNLLRGDCPGPGEERVEVLVKGTQFRLERIHSCLASSANGTWYDQREWEWVMVLRGSARLQFADEELVRDLCAGDSLLIAPHRRHRVVATDPEPGTLWLALFWWDAA